MYQQHRLRRAEDFARVRSEGRSWSNRLLVMYAAPNDLGYPRLGFAASRRLGSAVVRNRARRLLREAARLSLPGIRGGWDVVLIARDAMREAGMHQVRTALEQALGRARLDHHLDGAPWRGSSRSEEGMRT